MVWSDRMTSSELSLIQSRIPPGYLYAWLSSPLALHSSSRRPTVRSIPHIEAHHVVDLPVPRLDAAIEQRIHELVERAAATASRGQSAPRRGFTRLIELIGPRAEGAKGKNRDSLSAGSDMARLTAFSNRAINRCCA